MTKGIRRSPKKRSEIAALLTDSGRVNVARAASFVQWRAAELATVAQHRQRRPGSPMSTPRPLGESLDDWRETIGISEAQADIAAEVAEPALTLLEAADALATEQSAGSLVRHN